MIDSFVQKTNNKPSVLQLVAELGGEYTADQIAARIKPLTECAALVNVQESFTRGRRRDQDSDFVGCFFPFGGHLADWLFHRNMIYVQSLIQPE